MDGNPADGAKPNWRATLSRYRSLYRTIMRRAFTNNRNSDTNIPDSAVHEAVKLVEEKFYNDATSELDYIGRVGDFKSSQPVLMEDNAENLTPERESPSSNAGPAAPVNLNPQVGHLDPEQQYPGGVRLNVDPISAPMDLDLQIGLPGQQNLSGREQNLSGIASDSDRDPAPEDLTLRMGLSEQSHSRQCDSGHKNVPPSMPIPRRQVSQRRPPMPIPPEQVPQPRRSMTIPPEQVPQLQLSVPILPQQAPRPRRHHHISIPQRQPRQHNFIPIPRQQPRLHDFMPIPQQQVLSQPRLHHVMPIPQQQMLSQPRISIAIPQQQAQPLTWLYKPIPQQQAQRRPQLSGPIPRSQVPQQQSQLIHEYGIYLPPPTPEWQRSTLVFYPQPRWPAVLWGQLGVNAQSPLLGMSPRQQQVWWGMIVPQTELPSQWLDRLQQEVLPAGYVWVISFPMDTWDTRWFVVRLLPPPMWQTVLNTFRPDHPQLLSSSVVIIFPPGELQQQPQLPPPQRPPQQQQQGLGGHQAETSSGKRKG